MHVNTLGESERVKVFHSRHLPFLSTACAIKDLNYLLTTVFILISNRHNFAQGFRTFDPPRYVYEINPGVLREPTL